MIGYDNAFLSESKDYFKLRNYVMDKWFVLKSECGKHELGYPVGEILCRSIDDVCSAIKDHEIKDPVITPYLKYIEEKNDGLDQF